MSLPSIIIGILLSAVAIGIGVSYFGDTYSEGSAMATASTLASQGQQINEAADTFAAKNSGAEPTALSDLTTDSEYLSSEPNTGVTGVSWEYGEPETTNTVAYTTGGDVPDAVCVKAMENAGAGTDLDATAILDGSSSVDTALDGYSQLYGCYNDGSNNVFFVM